MDDKINPAHYRQGKYETIDVIESVTGSIDDGFEAHLVGSILKYVCRYKYKNGVTDLKKARWYLDRLIEHAEIRWPDWCKTCKADKSHCDKCEMFCNDEGPIDYPPSEYVGEKKEDAQEEQKTCGTCKEYIADFLTPLGKSTSGMCIMREKRVISKMKACIYHEGDKDE